MISRATLFSSPGGDTIQMIETANYLREINIEVDIELANKTINYDSYDLIHFFNIIRPSDMMVHIHRSKLPYLISTIFVDYSEYERKVRKGLAGFLLRLLNPDLVEYIKIILRFIKNGEKINSLQYLIFGHAKSIRRVLRGAKMLLPNSSSEYNRLLKRYNVKQEYSVIPNGINTSVFAMLNDSSSRTKIACMGRIEERKNQLNLIRAIKGTNYKLLIVGKPSPNNLRYYELCKEEATSNVTFMDHVDQDELPKLYNECKVHILASWFETTGLSSLEAAACGCNLVITKKGDTEEYFKNFAYYCNPDDPASIKSAIDQAYRQPYDKKFSQYILDNFTWQKTAELTLIAYNQVLAKNDITFSE